MGNGSNGSVIVERNTTTSSRTDRTRAADRPARYVFRTTDVPSDRTAAALELLAAARRRSRDTRRSSADAARDVEARAHHVVTALDRAIATDDGRIDRARIDAVTHASLGVGAGLGASRSHVVEANAPACAERDHYDDDDPDHDTTVRNARSRDKPVAGDHVPR
jgi:hypothetical protein